MSTMNRGALVAGVIAAIALAVAIAAGCDPREADDTCTDPTIMPHLSPVNFGDLQPAPEACAAAAGVQTIPYEWVLLLLSKCREPVVIDKVCLVGDAHNGVKGSPAFFLEGPVPSTATIEEEAALRITYSPAAVNTDLDGDGAPDPDNAALVIQSNAKNFPTLVVPICARLVPAGTKPAAFACTSPVTVAAGQRDLTLCP